MSELLMQYRTHQTEVRVANTHVRLETLADLNETIDHLFAELERTGRPELLEELCPYFGTLWPAARSLATRFEREARPGLRVLEIGCGLALPALVCALRGAEVTATDFHPEVPRFLERNRELNAIATSHLKYKRLDWNAPEANELTEGPWDWILASDVLYESHQATALARFLGRALSSGGARAWVADPARPYLQTFLDAAAAEGLQHRMETDRVEDLPVAKDVFLIELWR